MGTGWPYPLPRHLLILNIILGLSLALALELSTHNRQIKAARREAGYNGRWMSLEGVTRLCMGIPELDYDGRQPPLLYPVGPMLLPSPPLGQADSDLDAWIDGPRSDRAFTITFSLGSQLALDKSKAEDVLRVFEALLAEQTETRVYAKIMRMGDYDLPLLDNLERRFGKDRLRVVEWMMSDPIALLRTGKVDLAIHHGGSNSYHEALR
jgi:hypothetical protein